MGFGVLPWAILPVSLLAIAITARAAWRVPRLDIADLAIWTGLVLFLLAAILRLSWPSLLPPGRGPDLTHHLLLVDYIEVYGRLVHDRSLHHVMGEMAHYTPGAHLLAVMAGAWSGTDGLRAFFPLLALSAALTAGWVFLIARRLALPAPYAIAAVLLLLLPAPYFFGAFTHDSFLAQTVSTLFAVALWWALVVWDDQPSAGGLAVIAILLMGVFLAWPIWLGPPLLVFAALLFRADSPRRDRIRQAAIALGPLVALALLHAVGRWGWVVIVRTSGAIQPPSLDTVGWAMPVLGLAGLIVAARDRRARVTVVFLAVIAIQALTLYIIARTQGADTPYMAFKMIYLAIYPAAVLGAVAIANPERAILARKRQDGESKGDWGWIVASILMITIARPALNAPRSLPVVDRDLHAAGKWLRANVGQTCADYLVADADTAYWLHLAVLGNSRTSARMPDVDRYDPRTAAAPWITGVGRPYAIADRRLLPDEVRERVEIAVQFGRAAVIRRPGALGCPQE